MPALVVAASSAAANPDIETMDLKKLDKSRLLGGFTAQNIIGTGRRKCAIARVVLHEGHRKIINYRDAKKKVTVVMKKAGAKGQIMMIRFLLALFIVLFVLVFLT